MPTLTGCAPLIRAEGTEAIQAAWDEVEEHIDFVYQQPQDAP
jgi:hypothetical protein